MDYNTIIELDNVTVGDCIDWYEKRDGYVEINDGIIINLIDKKGDSRACNNW